MTIFLFIVAIISPAIFWIFYFRYKDRFKPEPVINLGGAFILGFIFSVVYLSFIKFLPSLGIPEDQSFFIFDGSLTSFIYLIFVVGFFEELFKLIPFIFIVKWFTNFDEKIDGIIYSSAVALGFAAYENILYLPHISGPELIGRAIASPLTHTIFASLWGYYAGKISFEKKKNYLKVAMIFIFSFVMHGLYDYLSLSSTLRILASVLILLIWIWRISLIEKQIKYINEDM